MAATPALSPMLDWPPRGSSSVSPSDSGRSSSSKIISAIYVFIRIRLCMYFDVESYFVDESLVLNRWLEVKFTYSGNSVTWRFDEIFRLI